MSITLKDHQVISIGAELFNALQARQTVPPLTTRFPDITLNDAYQIQQLIQTHHEQSGARVIGRKIGVTSKVVQDILGVHQPDFGFLTDRMQFDNESAISLSRAMLSQPRAEGEIAFLLKHDLTGPGITKEDVLAATDKVTPCFEIVDSRIADWKIKIQDTVADNASCGVFVLGKAWIDPSGIDLAAVHMDMYHNGELACTGQGSAVQGHPAEAVAWLANTLGALGVTLRAGDVILSGALGPLVKVQPNDHFELQMSSLGSASVSFVE